MPKQIMPAGEMNLDKGPAPGDHLWVAKNVVWQGVGYEKLPSWVDYGTVSLASEVCCGAFEWTGANANRVYYATDSRFYEQYGATQNNITGSTTPTNLTNRVSFAAYGEWLFAANGVDKIQAYKVPSSTGSSLNFSDMVYTTDGAVISPKYICSHKNHIVAANITFLESWAQIATHTTAVGGGFTQPAGSIIEVVSNNLADTTQLVTVWGTYTGGGDTLVTGTATLNGTASVDITNPNGVGSTWQKVLAWSTNAGTTGTITLQKNGGGTVITTIAPSGTATESGISTVAAADQAGGGRVIDIVCSAAGSVKQVGLNGTNYAGTASLDSQALAGTAAGVQSNSEFTTVTQVFIGDVANTDTITISSHVYPRNYNDPYLVWWSGTDDPEGFGNEVIAPQIIGSSDQPVLDGDGVITGLCDGGDCFFVFKSGSIHRFDGPPFQPTVVSRSTGIPLLTPPYKQKDRIYFWSNEGLQYINITDNSIGSPMKGKIDKSATHDNNASYLLTRGAWPASRQATNTSPLVIARLAHDGVYRGTISGDPANGLIYMAWSNNEDYNSLLYNEADDNFTVSSTPDNYSGDGMVAVTYGLAGDIGLLTKMIVFTTDGNNLTSKRLRPTPFSSTESKDVYLRWPFFSTKVDAPRSRIVAVRPVFNDSYDYVPDVPYAIQIDVISLNGIGKSWVAEGVLSKGTTATSSSVDGWFQIQDCPFADKHSIGVSIKATAASAGSGPGVQDFTHIEVEYVEQAFKGI